VTDQHSAKPRDTGGGLNSVRTWLTNNKVFFETLAATLLAAMAIIISIVQINIAAKQTALMELQAEVARQINLPQFSLAARQIRDPATGNATEDKIFVTNHGGLAQDVRCSFAVFFDIEVLRHERRGKFTEHTDSGIAHTATGKELVVTIEGYQNNTKACALERAFRELGTRVNRSASMDIRRYVRIRYRDIFGNQHTKYFFVPLIYGGTELSEEEALPLFERHESAWETKEMREFEELTAQDLMEIADSL
jgi:hypothetical protein